MGLHGKLLAVCLSTAVLLASPAVMAQAGSNKGVAVAQGLGNAPKKLVGNWVQAANPKNDRLFCKGYEHYEGGELDRQITIKSNRTFEATGYEHTIKGTFTKVVLSNDTELAGQVRYVELNEMMDENDKPKAEKGYVHFKISNGRLQLLKTIPGMDVDKRGLLRCS